jgi:putative ABC transport system substrate-binding protein
VLRGARPAETPILQPTRWEIVVNQKLARAVGWPAPRAVLLQATEVIE